MAVKQNKLTIILIFIFMSWTAKLQHLHGPRGTRGTLLRGSAAATGHDDHHGGRGPHRPHQGYPQSQELLQ